MEKIDYREFASKLFCYCVLVLVGILFFKYLFSYIAPFLVSWGVGYLVYPLAIKLSKKTKLSRKIWSFILVLFVLIILFALVFVIGNRILYEIQNLVAYLSENSDSIAKYFQKIYDYFSSVTENLPILNKLQNTGLSESVAENINILLNNVWQSVLESLGSAVPDIAREIVIALPNILLLSLVTIIACFYFAVDIDVVNKTIKQTLPFRVSNFVQRLKNKFIYGFKKYLKAYCIIFLVTFIELLIGFWILKVDYAFVLAIIISFIDFLPVLGVGAVLAPWGIVLLLMKNYTTGIGIITLFTVMTIIRQIIEPKIVGKSLGIHPIISLIAIYLGFQIWGIWGAVVFPILALVIFSKKEKENTI